MEKRVFICDHCGETIEGDREFFQIVTEVLEVRPVPAASVEILKMLGDYCTVQCAVEEFKRRLEYAKVKKSQRAGVRC